MFHVKQKNYLIRNQLLRRIKYTKNETKEDFETI